LIKWIAGLFSVFLIHSIAFAAPHITKLKPEPVERPGITLQERYAPHLLTGKMLAPASYPTSTVNILFLRVEFQEDLSPSTSKTTGSGLWSDPAYSYHNDPDYWLNSAKTNFVAYWNEVSYGLLPIAITVSPVIYRLPQKMYMYGDESSRALESLIYDSITTASTPTSAYPTISPAAFATYDAVLIVHAGAGEESDTAGNTSNDIWSLYYPNATGIAPDGNPLFDPLGVCTNCLSITLKDGKPIHEAIIMPQTDSQDGITVDPLGVYVHEFGHWLGLPDLYCTAGIFCIPDGAGKWSLMGDGIYNADPAACPEPPQNCLYGSSPAHLDAWSKVRLGWVSPRSAVPNIDLGQVAMDPVETSGDIIKIQASSSTNTQYFLLENRQNIGYDKGLPGHGLLIWLVDDVVVNNNFPTNSINNNVFRPGIKLIEADNDWKLLSSGCTSPDDCGSPGDPFPGSTNNKAFTLHTSPASLPYTPAAWVSIRNIAEVVTTPTVTSITADIGFAPLPPGTPGMYTNVVSWPSNTESDIAGYNVYKNQNLIATTSIPSFVDATARQGDLYQVTAVDTTGDESDFSGLVMANIQTSSGDGGGNPRCFIATAAYGSALDPHVEALRTFRDRVLLKNAPGKALVAMYYAYSPPAADFIREHESVRAVVRWTLTPIVYGVEYPLAVVMILCLGVVFLAVAGQRRRAK